MNNSPKFRLFSFHPTKLLEERIEVEKKFSNVEEGILKIRIGDNLPRLLDKIRKVEMKNIHKLINTFRKMDVMMLIYEYPFSNESHETRLKINEILMNKYTALVGITAWNLFQQDIHDSYLMNLLKRSYDKEKETFLNIDSSFLEPMGKAIEDKDGIINGLVKYLVTTRYPFKEVLAKWKVKKGSVLEEQLISAMLYKGLFSDFILKRDGTENIAEILNQYPMNEYKKLIKIYLEARNRDKFNIILLNQAIRRLQDPRVRKDDWTFLSAKAIKEVEKWLLEDKLKKFFENDSNNKRFDYWKRYIDYMEDVTPLKIPPVAFIYFKNFVVVEFGNIGNAAYFYHKDAFKEIILPRTKSQAFIYTSSVQRKESILKEPEVIYKGKKLFITKMSHSGNWQNRFDNEMRNLLIKFNE
ncbi:EH signature domain-containing protein [Neobacillus drentensis]|uniref:EH signature domain-containing protein n=1 Tax=Neobacillus drentensis TaxID=220684 RepID=UPI002FFF8C41